MLTTILSPNKQEHVVLSDLEAFHGKRKHPSSFLWSNNTYKHENTLNIQIWFFSIFFKFFEFLLLTLTFLVKLWLWLSFFFAEFRIFFLFFSFVVFDICSAESANIQPKLWLPYDIGGFVASKTTILVWNGSRIIASKSLQ